MTENLTEPDEQEAESPSDLSALERASGLQAKVGLGQHDERPWSPMALTVMSLFFGLGAMVMSVRNLRRLGVIDEQTARFYSWGTVVLLACIILLIWSFNPKAFFKVPQQQLAPLTLTLPFAVFFLQIRSFRRWRADHPNTSTRPWYTALLPVIGITLITVLCAVVAIDVFGIAFHGG